MAPTPSDRSAPSQPPSPVVLASGVGWVTEPGWRHTVQSHSRLWGMGSSPRYFRVFHHFRAGVVEKKKGIVQALETVRERTMWGKGGVPDPELGKGQFLPLEIRAEMGGIPASGCVTPDH